MARVWNFSAGPAMLPEAVLACVAAELLDRHGTGMSVAEMSHRGPEFMSKACLRWSIICASSRPRTAEGDG